VKKNKRPPEDFNSPSSARPFEIVVASSPSTEMSMVSELELAKVALLYGDQVTLISSMTTMLQEVEAFGRFSMEDQFELLVSESAWVSWRLPNLEISRHLGLI
jgi:hypothetical protein